jgi:2-dehydro-3-deoxyglucarate aldolase
MMGIDLKGLKMNKIISLEALRTKLRGGKFSIGSWMQIPHSSIAEILGQSGYDWVAIDLEHGSVSLNQLPDIFRALELGGTLPFARVAEPNPRDCRQALDAGAAGLIIPMVETASQLIDIRNSCFWPPAGKRGVGFSRANLFGKFFETYKVEAQSPFLVGMIENSNALNQLDDILAVRGLDAILVGPYDLSASLGITAQFHDNRFISIMDKILSSAKLAGIPAGIHVVAPSLTDLKDRIDDGFRFLAYSIDAAFLIKEAQNPFA